MTREEAEFDMEYIRTFSTEEIYEEYKVWTVEEAIEIIKSQIEEEEPEPSDDEGLGVYERHGFKNMSDYNKFINY